MGFLFGGGGSSRAPAPPQIIYAQPPAAAPAKDPKPADAQAGLENEWARLNRINEINARRVLSKPDNSMSASTSIKTLLGG